MIIVGAGGFAVELLTVIKEQFNSEEIFFFEEEKYSDQRSLFNQYPVLKTKEELGKHFEKNQNDFVLGLGNPEVREKMEAISIQQGGKIASAISKHAIIGEEEVLIGKGTCILPGAIVSNRTKIGNSCLIYYQVCITHDVKIGDYVELSPGAKLLGNCSIGNYCQIGAGAIILPNVIVGDNSIIGAGAVVRKNVPSNTMYAGVPASFRKKLND